MFLQHIQVLSSSLLFWRVVVATVVLRTPPTRFLWVLDFSRSLSLSLHLIQFIYRCIFVTMGRFISYDCTVKVTVTGVDTPPPPLVFGMTNISAHQSTRQLQINSRFMYTIKGFPIIFAFQANDRVSDKPCRVVFGCLRNDGLNLIMLFFQWLRSVSFSFTALQRTI